MEAAGDVFKEFSPPEDVDDLEKIKELIYEFLGVEPEKEEKPVEEKKPMTLKEKLAAKRAAEQSKSEEKPPAEDDGKMVIDFDPKDFNPETVYDKASVLGIGQLKKFYSQVKAISKAEMESNKPGITKETLLDNLANGLDSLANEGPKDAECVCPPQGESEITKQLVEDAAKAEDKDTLVAMCEKLGVTLNALEKRNVNRMKTKLLEKLPAEVEKPRRGRPRLNKEEPKEEAPITKDSKLVEIFELVENGVLEGKSEKEIAEAVTPLYKEMGRNPIQIKSRVKTMIEIVQVEHDLKKK
jgi:acyl carrier protein